MSADGNIKVNVTVRSVSELRQVQRQLGNTIGKVKLLSTGMGSLGNRLGFTAFQFTFLAGVAGHALSQIGQVLKSTVQQATAAQDQVVRAIAQSGIDIVNSTKETQEAVEYLNDAIRDLGSGKTLFSTKEVAQAAKEVGRAFTFAGGEMDKAQAVASVTQGVLRLMTIEQIGAEKAAIQLAKIMKQFNLTAQDTGRLVGVLTVVNQSSSATLDQLTASMSAAGNIGREFGITLEELAVGAGVLADRIGVKNSAAGRAFRRIMENLARTTQSLNPRLKAFGVHIRKSDGSLNSITDILRQFKTAMDKGGKAGSLVRQTILELGSTSILSKDALLALVQGFDDYEAGLRRLENAADVGAKLELLFTNTNEAKIKRINNAIESLKFDLIGGLSPALTIILEQMNSIVRETGVQELFKELGRTIAQDLIPIINILGKLFKVFANSMRKNEFILSVLTKGLVGFVGVLTLLFVIGTIGALMFSLAAALQRFTAFLHITTGSVLVLVRALLPLFAAGIGVFISLKAIDNIIGIVSDGFQEGEASTLLLNAALVALGATITGLSLKFGSAALARIPFLSATTAAVAAATTASVAATTALAVSGRSLSGLLPLGAGGVTQGANGQYNYPGTGKDFSSRTPTGFTGGTKTPVGGVFPAIGTNKSPIIAQNQGKIIGNSYIKGLTGSITAGLGKVALLFKSLGAAGPIGVAAAAGIAIGVVLALGIKQAIVDAKDFGFDNASEYIVDRTLTSIARMLVGWQEWDKGVREDVRNAEKAFEVFLINLATADWDKVGDQIKEGLIDPTLKSAKELLRALQALPEQFNLLSTDAKQFLKQSQENFLRSALEEQLSQNSPFRGLLQAGIPIRVSDLETDPELKKAIRDVSQDLKFDEIQAIIDEFLYNVPPLAGEIRDAQVAFVQWNALQSRNTLTYADYRTRLEEITRSTGVENEQIQNNVLTRENFEAELENQIEKNKIETEAISKSINSKNKEIIATNKNTKELKINSEILGEDTNALSDEIIQIVKNESSLTKFTSIIDQAQVAFLKLAIEGTEAARRLASLSVSDDGKFSISGRNTNTQFNESEELKASLLDIRDAIENSDNIVDGIDEINSSVDTVKGAIEISNDILSDLDIAKLKEELRAKKIFDSSKIQNEIGKSISTEDLQKVSSGGKTTIEGLSKLIQDSLASGLSSETVYPIVKRLNNLLAEKRLFEERLLAEQLLLEQAPKLANGGIIRSPTLATIGERGPEAVIPLNKLGNQTGSITNHITITVEGSIDESSANEMGEKIADEINRNIRGKNTLLR